MESTPLQTMMMMTKNLSEYGVTVALGLMQEPLVRADLFLSGTYEPFKGICSIHQFCHT